MAKVNISISTVFPDVCFDIFCYNRSVLCLQANIVAGTTLPVSQEGPTSLIRCLWGKVTLQQAARNICCGILKGQFWNFQIKINKIKTNMRETAVLTIPTSIYYSFKNQPRIICDNTKTVWSRIFIFWYTGEKHWALELFPFWAILNIRTCHQVAFSV